MTESSLQILSKITVPWQFEPLFRERPPLYSVFYGGRGGSKSYNIVTALVYRALVYPGTRILCVRESMTSLKESVKELVEQVIVELGLQSEFVFTENSVKTLNKGVQSDFIFTGMRNSNAGNVKSIANVGITFVEEASQLSKRSYTLLLPSVTRTKNPMLIFAFNPDKADDVVYEEFVAKEPPPNSYVCKINAPDNPWFKGSTLEQLMESDRLRMKPKLFAHIWEGELMEEDDDSLFEGTNFTPLNTIYTRQDYVEVVIGLDPATTNKDYSNEFGIVVVGKTREGILHILDDFSSQMSVKDFCSKVSEVSELFNTNKIVVEVNNGGDFIKAALLEASSFLDIHEVRSGSSKMDRALPVASLGSIGKIRFAKELKKLARQMNLATMKGFLGNKGESPDRLDAFVWAVYYLENILTKTNEWTYFTPKMVDSDLDYLHRRSIKLASNILYAMNYQNSVIGLVINIHKEVTDVRYEVTDLYSSSVDDFDGEGFTRVYFKEPTDRFVPFSRPSIPKLSTMAQIALPHLNQSKITINSKITHTFQNNYGNLLYNEIKNYKITDEQESPWLTLFLITIFDILGVDY